MYRRFRLLLVLLTVAIANLTPVALAHTSGISILDLTVEGQGVFRLRWQPAEQLLKNRPAPSLRPSFSQHCEYLPPRLSCSPGKQALIDFSLLPSSATVIVHLTDVNQRQSYQLVKEQRWSLPEAMVHADSPNEADAEGLWVILADYLLIGVEHIVLGFDHLLFVVSLLLLVGFKRILFWTITAFTLGHSITLILSVFDWFRVAITPVEILIALSIVLVVREAMTSQQTLTKRFPWLIALVFGLIHGLGFASALAEVGLPEQQKMVALLAFNLGVETGQLLMLGLFYLVYQVVCQLLLRSRGALSTARLAVLYVAGVAGSYWFLERSLGFMENMLT